jgi:hypothetical protein
VFAMASGWRTSCTSRRSRRIGTPFPNLALIARDLRTGPIRSARRFDLSERYVIRRGLVRVLRYW